MVNQQKIVTMTKLALYDKNEADVDQQANDYFRHDYIYRKNLTTRISVGIGGFFILLIYWLSVVLIQGVDVFDLNLEEMLMNSVLFIVALLAVYSLIGTIKGTREYYLMQKRLDRYQALVRQLERIEDRARKQPIRRTTAEETHIPHKEAADPSHGADSDR